MTELTVMTKDENMVVSCVNVHQLLSPSQRKQLEIERAEKWLKMVKKWDKYKNSDRVSNSPHIPDLGHMEPENTFYYFHLKLLHCWRLQTIADKYVKWVLVSLWSARLVTVRSHNESSQLSMLSLITVYCSETLNSCMLTHSE